MISSRPSRKMIPAVSSPTIQEPMTAFQPSCVGRVAFACVTQRPPA